MKKVYICSPCRGDYENNIQRAKEYSRAAVEKGVIPVTPHIYLTQFMDDNVPEERELALKIGSELVLGCSELWAFGIDHPSAGMAAEIELAKAHGIPVRNGFEAISELKPDEELENSEEDQARTSAASRCTCPPSGRWPSATSTSTTAPSASSWMAASSSSSPTA